jgi:hypothetical protein
MKHGWNEVARLGKNGKRYPHLLVDAHGWCLRLGSDRKRDDKYYSRLTTLLEGLAEQGVRRDLVDSGSVSGIHELTRAVRSALARMIRLGRRLETIPQESPLMRPAASAPPTEARTTRTAISA